MKLLLCFMSLLPCLTAYAESYDCKISHTMVRPEGELNSSWHVFIKDNSGIITIDGVLHNENKSSASVSRQIFFNVEKFSQQGYRFTSQRIKKNPVENIGNEDVSKYLPDFFIYEDRKTMFTITRSGNSSVMSWATDPMFFCY